MSNFEKQVRKALIDKGMTLSEFADKLEISVSYLYEIIRGTRIAKVQKQKIRDFLELSDTV